MHRPCPTWAGQRRPVVIPALWLALAMAAFTTSGPIRPATADELWKEREIVVVLEPGASIDAVNLRWGTITLDAYPEADLYLVEAPAGIFEPDFADELEGDPDVMKAEPNFHEETPEGIREMVLSATGGTYGDYLDQTAAERIGVEEAHAGSRGAGVVVAVLDTGIDPEHEVFQTSLRPDGYDFVDEDAEPWETANGIDDDQDGLVDEGYGHGTLVAGLVALVAPEAEILPLRVLDDEGRGNTFNIAKAIRYADLHGAQVINMSLGSPFEFEAVSLQFELIEESEPTIVSGAGNENRDSPAYYPGRLPPVFMVTALDSADVKADFADYYHQVLVAAPGAGIRGPFPGGEWAIGWGCSFAVPFVAGEAALVRSVAPSIAPHELAAIITGAVEEIYDLPGNLPYDGMLGSGRIHLPTAIQLAIGTSGLASPGMPPGAVPELAIRAFPNPAPATVRLAVPEGIDHAGMLQADIFDVTGRLIRRVHGHGDAVHWNGRDLRGATAPAGLYLVRLHDTGSASWSGRFLMVR
ncbi:MAG: S8 family serine peptidase [Candidatus Eiseniibacteriota bacterium]|jgi:subtilisin family serine protease